MSRWTRVRSAGLVGVFLLVLLTGCNREAPFDVQDVQVPGGPGQPAPGAPPDPGPGSAGPPDPRSPEELRQIELDRQRGLLRHGQIVRDIPKRMRHGQTHRVAVRATGEEPPPDLFVGLSPGATAEPAFVGSDLVADLSGPDFEITRVGAADDGTRTLSTKSYVEWQWSVRPQRGGTLFLQVVLYVRLQDNPDAAPTDVRTYSENVSVEVDPMLAVGAWFREYGAATGITVPVIGGAAWFILTRLVRRRDSRGAGSSTPAERSARPGRERRSSRGTDARSTRPAPARRRSGTARRPTGKRNRRRRRGPAPGDGAGSGSPHR
jgi:hypothetical protein